MGKIDNSFRKYVKPVHRLTALFNGIFFQGTNAIGEGCLRPVGEALDENILSLTGEVRVRREPDLSGVATSGTASEGLRCVLLITEMQDYIDYLIAARVFLEEAAWIQRQVSALRKRAREEDEAARSGKAGATGFADRHELLAGVRATDRLDPIDIAVLYTGSDPWNAPLAMGDLYKEYPGLTPLSANYRIRLIDLSRDDLTVQDEGLQSVLDAMTITARASSGKDAAEKVGELAMSRALGTEEIRTISEVTGLGLRKLLRDANEQKGDSMETVIEKWIREERRDAADKEKNRADTEKNRADKEKNRADTEKNRADALEREILERARRQALELHSMGMDADHIAKFVELDAATVRNWLPA